VWLVDAALVVVVALLVVLALLPLRHSVSKYNAQQRLIAEVAAAGRQQAINFNDLNYKDVTSYSQVTAANSVGTFHNQSVSIAEQFETQAVAAQAVSTPNVDDVAVIVITPAHGKTPATARTMEIVDDLVTNKQDPAGVVKRLRLEIDLQQVGNSWLVTNLIPVA
jgi:hypothetical protein